jgi:putative ABC transport system ATP-binding protein
VYRHICVVDRCFAKNYRKLFEENKIIMLEIKELSKLFNVGKEDEVRALSNLNLTIKEGEFVMVVGSNGSGKSTLMNLILGSVPPTSGSIKIGKDEISKLAEHHRSKWVSMVFQNPSHGTAPELSILENFRLAALRTGSKKVMIGLDDEFRKKTAEKISKLGMGLESKLNQRMGSLSGGQKQALTLLMGIMDKTSLLLMDEPTSALDPKSSKTIMDLAEKINKEMGVTILLVTHSMKDALQYGNRLLLFREGSLKKDLQGEEKKQLELPQIYQWFNE